MKLTEGHSWKDVGNDVASGILMLILLGIAIFFTAAFQP